MLLSIAAGLLIVLTACTDDPVAPVPSTGGTEQPTSTYEVEYTSETVFIDSASTANTFLSVDTSGRIFTFRKSNTTVAQLKAGDQLLVFRKGMGQVASTSTQGEKIVVTTTSTTLNKVIKNANINWEYPVSFDGSFVPQAIDRKGVAHIMTPKTPDSFETEIEWGDFTYKINWKMQGDNAQVEIHVEKKIFEALRARYSMVGTLNKFKTTTNIRMQDGQLVKYELSNPNLKGQFKLSVNCAGSGNDAVNLELPVTLIKVPITVGALVVVMDVRVQVVVNSVVPADGSSLINVDFAYESSTGFSYEGGQIKGLGSSGTYEMNKGTATQTGASTPVAATFGLGFPRLEFKLFDTEVLVPWVQTAMLIGGDFVTGVHPCQQAKAQFIGAAGADLKLFGLTLKKNVQLWNQEKILLKAGDCR